MNHLKPGALGAGGGRSFFLAGEANQTEASTLVRSTFLRLIPYYMRVQSQTKNRLSKFSLNCTQRMHWGGGRGGRQLRRTSLLKQVVDTAIRMGTSLSLREEQWPGGEGLTGLAEGQEQWDPLQPFPPYSPA